jgi:hypothetical protein
MRRCWVDSNFSVVYFFCLSSFVSSVNCVGVNVKGWFLLERLAAKRYLHTKCGRERERDRHEASASVRATFTNILLPETTTTWGLTNLCVCVSLSLYTYRLYIYFDRSYV